MKKYIPTLLISVLLFGCELAVDVDVPVERRRLTLNSFFTPDSVWKAHVLLSRHVLDNSQHYDSVTNASIMIYQEGQPLQTLTHVGYGEYRSTTGSILPGVPYEIRADVPGYASVRSQSAVPEPVAIRDLNVTYEKINDWAKDATFSFKFTDRPNETNYYEIKLIVYRKFKYFNGLDSVESINEYATYIESDDPAFQNENDGFYDGLIFKDVLFEGKEVNVKFKTTVGIRYPSDDQEEFRYTVYLRTLSEDYYQYMTTSSLQEYTSGDPFAQPVTVYNNIENGFGIFAGYSQSAVVYEPD